MTATPLMRIPVGVVVERRNAVSAWLDVIWKPIAVLDGRPDAAPWTQLAIDGEVATFYAGGADIELFRSEAENYRSNLASQAPSIWVVLFPTGTEPPYEVATVTADPAEGEALTEPGQAIVEAVAMPERVRDIITAFVAAQAAAPAFEKRTRDRADLESLARRRPSQEDDHGR